VVKATPALATGSQEAKEYAKCRGISFGIGRRHRVNLVEKNLPYVCGFVLRGIWSQTREHLLDNSLITFDGLGLNTTMLDHPIAKALEF
jgi:hypothetical protein